MNFFRDKELAERFAADNVSEREVFYYFLVFNILIIIFTTSTVISVLEIKLTIWDQIYDVVAIISTVIGCTWTYKINISGDDKNFVARFISLSFPIGVKSTILLFILLIPIAGLLIANEEMYNKALLTDDVGEALFFGAYFLTLLYFYLRLAYAMKIASKPASN